MAAEIMDPGRGCVNTRNCPISGEFSTENKAKWQRSDTSACPRVLATAPTITAAVNWCKGVHIHEVSDRRTHPARRRQCACARAVGRLLGDVDPRHLP